MAFYLVFSPTQKMLRRILYSLVLLSLTNVGLSFGQQPAPSEPGPAELKELLRRAGIGMSEYKTGFKDLTAEEEQKVEQYDEQGRPEKQRRIVSDLVIYQSQLDPTQMVEYRDVKSVDGVAIKKREARLVSLLNKSAKADSVKKELDRIYRESRRYDLEHSFYGMTLNQGLPLEENARESFQFTFAGREQVNGQDAIVLEYQQVSPMPDFKSDLSGLPSPLKGAEVFFRGRLWLDAETAQLRREVREITLRLPSLSRPLVLYRFDLDYADSRFGFLTPRRIVVTIYSRGRTGADKKPELLLGGKVTFEYGAFSRFAVEVPDASLNPPVKP
jgi:Sec-independent protein translocase protein TatA